MTVFFAASSTRDVYTALKLSEKTDKLFFYSPNPYIMNQAVNYSLKTHHPFSRQSFIKLVADGKFVQAPISMEAVDEVWVCVNTLKAGEKAYSEAENIVNDVAERVVDVERFVLAGQTWPGQAEKLFSLFRKKHPTMAEIFFLGRPTALIGGNPLWAGDDGGGLPIYLDGFSPIHFDVLDEAERATVILEASESLWRFSMLRLSYFFEAVETLPRLVERGFVDELNLQVFLALERNGFKGFDGFLRDFGKLADELEGVFLRELTGLMKRGRQVKLALVGSEEAVKRLQGLLPKRGLRVVFIEEDLVGGSEELLRGVDYAVVVSSSLEVLRAVGKVCKKVWFIPVFE